MNWGDFTIRECNKDEEKEYKDICRYCFPSEIDWQDKLFDRKPYYALGAFDDEKLVSAVISITFKTRVFDELTDMSGISAVVSLPEVRNRGLVKKLLAEVLNHEYRKGYLVSALYPFKFSFYERMGYGYLHSDKIVEFAPSELKKMEPLGSFKKVKSRSDYKKYQKLRLKYVKGFNFGIEREDDSDNFMEILKFFKQNLYMYVRDGVPTGYIQYEMKNVENSFSQTLIVSDFGFIDAESFRAVFGFISVHRDQCSKVSVTVPGFMNIKHLFKEPRVNIKILPQKMARVLDVEKVFKLRLKKFPAKSKIKISVDDPILTNNTGTYIIEGEEIEKSNFAGINRVPFSVFSSLVFGAVTFEEAYNCGLVDFYDASMDEYFSFTLENWITEDF